MRDNAKCNNIDVIKQRKMDWNENITLRSPCSVNTFNPYVYGEKWGLQCSTLFFLLFAESIDSGCLLGPPYWGANEHRESM